MSSFDLKSLYFKYLESPDSNEEFEVKFGTKSNAPIQRDSFDDVIKFIKSKGFELKSQETMLRANALYTDKQGKTRVSRNIRTTILGAHNIQAFCRTNSLKDESTMLRPGTVFERKQPKMIDEQRAVAEVEPFNFRATYHEEEKLSEKFGIAQDLIDNWASTKKVFRYVKRFSFTKDDPLFKHLRIDLSITKNGARKMNKGITPVYTVQESDIFNMREHYELEIEVDKAKVSPSNKESSYKMLHKAIMYVLSGIQQTPYPVSFKELKGVGQEYYTLIHKELPRDFIRSSDFIGPSSVSLEIKHIVDEEYNTSVVNIQNNYAVTDKADGMRKLLYISGKGKMYLIDTNMKIQYTGSKCDNDDLKYTIIDGEHILYDKQGNFINTYAAFDVYFIHKEDERAKPFHPGSDSESERSGFRYNQLLDVVRNIEVSHETERNTFKIIVKEFEYGGTRDGDTKTIFEASRHIMSNVYNYETDGLIYTPINLGVGLMPGETGPPSNKKITWSASLKWKPPEFNTIDFLATTEKENGKDLIKRSYIDNKTETYKTFILRVGYNKKMHGYINPCANIINDQVPTAHSTEKDNYNSYEPVPFYPMSPPDLKAHVCNVSVDEEENAYIEDLSEIITDGTIIECKYDETRPEGWRFVPIRIRHDKTAQYQNKIKNYGNAFHVAQSVWSSIHNPISVRMITTGLDIPIDDSLMSDIYYKRDSGKSYTVPMRDFHNLYVKRKLITSVSKPGDTLIDLAVGKAGDMSKWSDARLKFVFGVDIAKDNIENRLDGACARYLNKKATSYRMFDALFIQGDSGKNLKSGAGIDNEQYKKIMKAIYGEGPKDESVLGKGIYKKYGMIEDGFNVVSCQFALHYFFEDTERLLNFLVNVSQNCKLGGYFVGTCFNGRRVFQELSKKKKGEKISKFIKGKKIFEITKQYDSSKFERNASSLGLPIDVYQESINSVFREYLVNFEYLKDIMELFGFDVLPLDQARDIDMPAGMGGFEGLYDTMNHTIKKEQAANERKYSKTKSIVRNSTRLGSIDELKYTSYLNEYFIFVKNRNVDPLSITQQSITMVDSLSAPIGDEDEESQEQVKEKPKKLPSIKIKKGKKLGRKIRPKKKT